MGEELARIVDQVALWVLVDVLPGCGQVATSSWEFLVANSQTLNHLALVAAGIVGIPLLWIRTRASDRQARTGEQGHITDRFNKAVEQLGNTAGPVRLGAIYALERISRDSPRDHWTVMETLMAYVREKARSHESALPNPFVQLQAGDLDRAVDELPEETRPTEEIRAVLTVFGRRNARARRDDQATQRRLDLANINLSGISLPEWNFQRAILSGANLPGLCEPAARRAILCEPPARQPRPCQTTGRGVSIRETPARRSGLCEPPARLARRGGTPGSQPQTREAPGREPASC